MAAARTTQQRIEDSQAKLEQGGDAWLATAGEMGPHLVPLSLAWDQHNEEIIFCTELQNRAARNIEKQPAVRVALGSTRDVLMIYGTAEIIGTVDDEHAPAQLFAAKTGWTPRADTGNWGFIRISPKRMQAWREVNEIQNRTIMKDGKWIQ